MFKKDSRLEELVDRFKRYLYASANGRDFGAIECDLGRYALCQYETGSWEIAVKSGCGGYNTLFRLYGSSVMHLNEDVYELLTLLRSRQVLDDLADV